MKFSILSIHPQLCEAFFSEGLIQKARMKGLIQTESLNLRDFADPPHFRVDDKPYGGGAGMVLQCGPIVKALRSAVDFENVETRKKTRIVVLAAKGKIFNQETAQRFQKNYDHLVFISGRYEGIDERIAQFYADE